MIDGAQPASRAKRSTVGRMRAISDQSPFEKRWAKGCALDADEHEPSYELRHVRAVQLSGAIASTTKLGDHEQTIKCAAEHEA